MQAYLEREKELVLAKNSDQDAGLIFLMAPGHRIWFDFS